MAYSLGKLASTFYEAEGELGCLLISESRILLVFNKDFPPNGDGCFARKFLNWSSVPIKAPGLREWTTDAI